MVNRKLFLVLALICIAPLLILALFLYVTLLSRTRNTLRAELDQDLANATSRFDVLLTKRVGERQALAGSRSIVDYLSIIDNRAADDHRISKGGIVLKGSDHADELVPYLKDMLSAVLTEKSYAAIAGFGSDRRLRFVAEPPTDGMTASLAFREQNFLHNESQPDEKIWSAKAHESICGITGNAFTGRNLRCATPVFTEKHIAGAIVTELKLNELLSDVALSSESTGRNGTSGSAGTMMVVLDQSGEIVYHTNNALRHQHVSTSFADFEPVAGPMKAGQTGAQTFRSTGDHWLAVYSPLKIQGLSLAIARNSSREVADARKWGLIGFGLAAVLGLGTAAILATQYQRKSRGIERVSEDVAAIAKGELDLEVDVRSRDDMRPLADSVNLMTKRLREQISHESETRQFQSFVRLSAMLTHDLKNAIGGLSLLVSNMDAHYANEEFRADAMKSLTNATEKLKSLVDRISNPVTTLSGEYKLPIPIDLVPLIKRIVPHTIGRISGSHLLEMNLPSSLVAYVDSERIEKVIENLVLNGLEAMQGVAGTLRVEAGKQGDGKVYFAVTDTGVGMSKRFMDEKLFHAFATTKKSGMGLGLYTCREVVTANGGTIEVTSKQGDGTTFRVVLPSPPPEEPV